MESSSKVASTAGVLGAVALVAAALGPMGIQIGVFSAFIGFRIFGLGLLLGLIAIIVGMVGLWHTRAAAGREGRGRALAGVGSGLLLVVIVVASVGSRGSAPPINDITTDPADPPAFVHAQEVGASGDLSYPGEEFTVQQLAAYPDLAPIALNEVAAAAFDRAEAAAESLGWEIHYRDEPGGVFEATDSTRIFRFVDDIAVRIRTGDAGSIVDVRSKSRDGRGDIGANAARIRAFRDALGGTR